MLCLGCSTVISAIGLYLQCHLLLFPVLQNSAMLCWCTTAVIQLYKQTFIVAILCAQVLLGAHLLNSTLGACHILVLLLVDSV